MNKKIIFAVIVLFALPLMISSAPITYSFIEPDGGNGCVPDWHCGSWGTCSGGTQSRTCTDWEYCDTTEGRPPLSQTCCTDDCTPSGSTRCSGDAVQTCGDYDTDSCLEWERLGTLCSYGCSGGSCNSCTPSCTGDSCGQSDGCGGTCSNADASTCGKCGNAACCTPATTCPSVSWSTCTKTCGTGTQSRSCADGCSGTVSETQNCNTQACDTTNPSVGASHSPTSSIYTTTSVTITATGADGGSGLKNIKIYGGTATNAQYWVKTCTSSPCLTSSTHSAGTYYYYTRSEDNAGNTGTTSQRNFAITACTPSCTGDSCGQSNGCGGWCSSVDAYSCGICGNAACIITVSLQAIPYSGIPPLTVSLYAIYEDSRSVSGTNLRYMFDCTNDGTYEIVVNLAGEKSYTAFNACTYTSFGTYTAKLRLEQSTLPEARLEGYGVTTTTIQVVCASSGGACSSTSDCCSGYCSSGHCCANGYYWEGSLLRCESTGGTCNPSPCPYTIAQLQYWLTAACFPAGKSCCYTSAFGAPDYYFIPLTVY